MREIRTTTTKGEKIPPHPPIMVDGIKVYDEFYDKITEHITASKFHTKLTKGGSINPYPTAFPYGNGMVLHFYQQQESSTTKTVHKVINKGLKTYV